MASDALINAYAALCRLRRAEITSTVRGQLVCDRESYWKSHQITAGNKRVGKGNHGKNQHTEKGGNVSIETSARFDEEVSALTGKAPVTIRGEVAAAKKLDRAVGEEAAKEISPTRLGGTKEGVTVVSMVARPHCRD